jgi:putative transcriptional regulator
MKEPASGMLLIAEPFLKDPNFARSVIILCEHREEGSFGLVLNRSFDKTLEELIPDLEGMDIPVSDGGPVQRDTLHFLHRCPRLIPGGLELGDGIFWGGDFELAISLLREKRIERTEIRFFIGYSGWTGGQLGEEMQEKSWLVTPVSARLVFPRLKNDIWKDSLRGMGGEFGMLVNFPTDPSLN